MRLFPVEESQHVSHVYPQIEDTIGRIVDVVNDDVADGFDDNDMLNWL